MWRTLDLALDVVDCVGGLNLEGDSLASECLDKDLHTTTKSRLVSGARVMKSSLAYLRTKWRVDSFWIL